MPKTKKLLIGLTGRTDREWQSKLKEINQFKITEIALFLEFYRKRQREKIYQALLKSKIKKIPQVHLRNDIERGELEFLTKTYKPACFTIHESSFRVLNNWKGFYKKLFLEMNYDNFISNLIKVDKIGGFCVDLSHFKASEKKFSKEFKYIIKRKNASKYFICNHLNGYSYRNNTDLHIVKSLKDFNYLKSLPKFLFGKYIAIEVFNSIVDQIIFKKHLINLLKKRGIL